MTFQNKGAPIEQVEVEIRIWRPDEPSKSVMGIYLPLGWQGRSPFAEVKAVGKVWPRLKKKDSAFTWLALQHDINGELVWEVPFEGQAKSKTLSNGNVFELDILLSWDKEGGKEKGEKYWSFPMKVEQDGIEIIGMDHVYLADMSKVAYYEG